MGELTKSLERVGLDMRVAALVGSVSPFIISTIFCGCGTYLSGLVTDIAQLYESGGILYITW